MIALRSDRPTADLNVRACCLRQLALRSDRPTADLNVRACCLRQLAGIISNPNFLKKLYNPEYYEAAKSYIQDKEHDTLTHGIDDLLENDLTKADKLLRLII